MEEFEAFDTMAVHAGEEADAETGALRQPLHMSTTFKLPGFGIKLFEALLMENANTAYVYTRWGNPTLRALEKRPVGTEAIEAAICRILHRLRSIGERELPTRLVGEWVMEELRELDEVAYVRFASVYRRFQDVNAFREEIERLQNEPPAQVKRSQLTLLDGDKE